MALYDYEKSLADLQNKYSQDEATNAYARFISKQRFARQRQDSTKGYQQAFPGTVAQLGRGQTSGIRSGVFLNRLNQFVGGQNQGMARLNEDEAAFDSNEAQNQALRQAQYQQSLLALQEELNRQRAMQNPYAPYQGVYGVGQL
jgi:hypothetical protein